MLAPGTQLHLRLIFPSILLALSNLLNADIPDGDYFLDSIAVTPAAQERGTSYSKIVNLLNNTVQADVQAPIDTTHAHYGLNPIPYKTLGLCDPSQLPNIHLFKFTRRNGKWLPFRYEQRYTPIFTTNGNGDVVDRGSVALLTLQLNKSGIIFGYILSVANYYVTNLPNETIDDYRSEEIQTFKINLETLTTVPSGTGVIQQAEADVTYYYEINASGYSYTAQGIRWKQESRGATFSSAFRGVTTLETICPDNPVIEATTSALKLVNPLQPATTQVLVDAEDLESVQMAANGVSCDGTSLGAVALKTNDPTPVTFRICPGRCDAQLPPNRAFGVLLPLTPDFPINGSTIDPLRGDTSLSGINPVESRDRKSYFASALYRPPWSIPPAAIPGAVSGSSPSFIEVQATQGSATSSAFLNLYGPPVVLVHGLWSDSSAWSGLGSHLRGYYPAADIVAANYASLADRSFLDGGIQDIFRSACRTVLSRTRDLGIIAGRIDVVGHSMGGLVARAASSDPDFKSQESYGRPRIRQLITVGTPHLGSEMASWLFNHKDAGSIFFGQTLAKLMLRAGKNVEGGAVEDLKPNSTALNGLPMPPIVSISGAAPPPSLSFAVRFLNTLLSVYDGSTPRPTTDSLLGAGNDSIVSQTSQVGSVLSTVSIPGIVHAAFVIPEPTETNSPGVFDQVETWLRDTSLVPSAQVRASPLQGRQIARSAHPLAASCTPGISQIDLSTMAQAPSGSLVIGNSSSGTLTPDAATTVTVTALGKTLNRVIARYSSVINDICSSPFSFDIVPDSVSPVTLDVIGLFASGDYARQSVTYPVSTASLRGMTVKPAGIRLQNPGDEVEVQTLAGFGLKVMLDVSSLATYGIATGGGSIVTVSPVGVVQALAPGSTSLLVSYGGFSSTVPVLVFPGFGAESAASKFYVLPPCRVLDTRGSAGVPVGGPILSAQETRTVFAVGDCGIPATAKSISGNVTVTAPTQAGYLTLYAGDRAQPSLATSINFKAAQTRANNIVLELSTDGMASFNVFAGTSGRVHVIFDVNGYFK